jgi:hypothetical protein
MNPDKAPRRPNLPSDQAIPTGSRLTARYPESKCIPGKQIKYATVSIANH